MRRDREMEGIWKANTDQSLRKSSIKGPPPTSLGFLGLACVLFVIWIQETETCNYARHQIVFLNWQGLRKVKWSKFVWAQYANMQGSVSNLIGLIIRDYWSLWFSFEQRWQTDLAGHFAAAGLNQASNFFELSEINYASI